MRNKIIYLFTAISFFIVLFSSESDATEFNFDKNIILKYTPIESSPAIIIECAADNGTKIMYEGKIYERSDSADIFLLKLGVRQPEDIKTEEEKIRLLGNLYIWYPHVLPDNDISLLSGRNRKSELFKITRLFAKIQRNRIRDIKNVANQTSICISLGILSPIALYFGSVSNIYCLVISTLFTVPLSLISETINLLISKPVKKFFVNNEIKYKTRAFDKEIESIFEKMNAIKEPEERENFLRKKSLELKKKYFYEENKYFSVY